MPKKTVNNDDVYHLHEYCLDLKNRTMWIHGTEKGANTDGEETGVEYQMANKAIKNLHILKNQSSTRPITIYLHTCGGSEVEGFAIYDAIKSMPFEVTIISTTHARSMSSIILQAGDIRLLYPNSYFMIHRGTITVDDIYEKVSSYVSFCKLYEEKMFLIYAEKMVQSDRFSTYPINKACSHIKAIVEQKSDWYMLAEQAVLYNFADGIYKG